MIYLGIHHDFAELDALMKRFSIRRCVIDAMPELHATRAFAKRHSGSGPRIALPREVELLWDEVLDAKW